MLVKKNILETIGHTPMVRINRLGQNPNVNIFAKLEGFNPTGSIKDRIVLQMIEQAEREGRLIPGKTIIEPTSGNTGIGLAIIGIVKGYPVEIVMSEAVSVERRKIIRSYGGKVILTPAAEGTDGAIRKAHQLVEENPGKYFTLREHGHRDLATDGGGDRLLGECLGYIGDNHGNIPFLEKM